MGQGMTLVQQLREKYRPQQIRLLLLAESPPDCEGGDFRFFYAPTKSHDNLYQNVMKVVFSDFEPARDQKMMWLEKFRDAGCYLVDATDTPVNHMSDKEKERILLEARPAKIMELQALVGNETPIVAIKANVCKVFLESLRLAKLTVLNQGSIPFPSHGNQTRFQKLFRECLARAAFIPGEKA